MASTTGADDYVVKPFSVPELMARVRRAPAACRARARCRQGLSFGDIALDRTTRSVTRAGRDISLGPTEFRLLEALLESQVRACSHTFPLLDRVWGSAAEIDDRTVDVHIGRLRKALVRGDEPAPIRTVRGSGYAMAVDA